MNRSQLNFYLKHHWVGRKAALCFRSDRIRTVVSMVTESSHRAIMEKTLSPLCSAFFHSILFILAGMMTYMRARTSSNIDLIRPRNAELAALDRLKNPHRLIKYGAYVKNDVFTFSRLFLIGSFSYLQVMITYMRAWISLKFGQIQPLVSLVTDRVILENNGVFTFSRLFFIRSFSYLQVLMTCMRAWTSSNFGLIRPPTAELHVAAIARLKNPHRLIMEKGCFHFFSAVLGPILFILSGNDNIHKSLDEIEIQPDSSTGFHGNR